MQVENKAPSEARTTPGTCNDIGTVAPAQQQMFVERMNGRQRKEKNVRKKKISVELLYLQKKSRLSKKPNFYCFSDSEIYLK